MRSGGRLALGFAAMLAAGSVGAVVLGEYDLRGALAVVASLLYGVVLAEVLGSIARKVPVAALPVLAVAVALGLSWAVWISFNHLRSPVPAVTWASVALGASAAAGWAGLTRSRRPAGREQQEVEG